jgi:dTDP-4-amino-4,6-dideoxygalactose transaminase
MQIPFVNLHLDDACLREEIRAGIDEVIRRNAFAGGPFVAAFEKDFACFCEAEYCIGVGTGTDALWLALLGLGIGPGDEVITVPNTFIATAEAISFCGATPVFVDVDEKTYTMDPSLLEAAITSRTKAIIPVHLYGQPADMDPILEIARKHRLFVVEDACQAHGALYKGKKVGSLGHAGCFSFYPTKNLGAFGEAGAVVTNDRLLKERIECLRDHGQKARYQHQVVGWNGRMDGIQGAVLTAKLKRLAADNERRLVNARLYGKLLGGVPGLTLPSEAAYGTHVYHLFVVRTERDRSEMMSHLAAKGIGSLVHYPTPVHLQEAYRGLQLRPGSFPRAEAAAQQILSLPMFPGLSPNEITRVATEVREFLRAGEGEPAYGRAA